MKPRPEYVLVGVIGALVGAGLVLLGPLLPDLFAKRKYECTCIIRAGQSEVAEMLIGQPAAKPRAGAAILQVNMLNYTSVMQALAGSGIVREEVEEKSDGNSVRRRILEEELHQRIVANTRIRPIGAGSLIRVSYYDDTSERAFTVLNRVVTNFVENALMRELEDAKRAKNLVWSECKRLRDELDSLDARIVMFQQDHPSVVPQGPGSVPALFGKTREELRRVVREIDGKGRKLAMIDEQIANMPKHIPDEPGPPAKEDLEIMIYRALLDSLRVQLAANTKTLPSEDPAVVSLRKQIETAEKGLALLEKRRTKQRPAAAADAGNPEVIIRRALLAHLRIQQEVITKTYPKGHPAMEHLRKQTERIKKELASLETEARPERRVVLKPNKDREERKKMKLDLELEIDELTENRRSLQIEKNRLEELNHALPALHRELGQLKREREAISEEYDAALERYKKFERKYNLKMEGLVTFSVHSRPRWSRKRVIPPRRGRARETDYKRSEATDEE